MTDLKISEISVEPIENEKGLIGFANFVINNDFKVCNVAIHSCPKAPTGIRIVFPTREYNGLRFHTIYPINKAAYEVIVVAISNAYLELMEKLR